MADNVKVKVKTLAYERYRHKTQLSEFENDLEFVSKAELLEEIAKLRQWILENGGSLGGGDASGAIAGGNLCGGDVTLRDTVSATKIISGQDVTKRVGTPVRYYFYGGDVKTREATI